MMTSKQEWYLNKLLNELREKDAEKYDTNWEMMNLASAWATTSYEVSKSDASHDIQLCLDELKK